MHRFFLSTQKLGEPHLVVGDDELYHQITKVLRMNIGDEVILFDGDVSIDYVYCIGSIDKKSIIFSYVSRKSKSTHQAQFHLYQALPNKIDKIELILQKGVEIGCTSFTFFSSSRSQNIHISKNKLQRFQKIIIEAVEQSNRNDIPTLQFVSDVDMGMIMGDKIVCHTGMQDAYTLKDIITLGGDNMSLFVGPEGGFTPEEIEYFQEKGAKLLYLGDRVLRTETVAMCVGFALLQLK